MEQVTKAASDEARVLVVDDEPVICDILRDFLEYEGYRVYTAADGQQALEVLRRERFQIEAVLTDMKMPGLGGIDLLHRIADEDTDIVTIIMTGFGTVETAIEAMKNGAFDYILKPFKPEEVVRVLHRGLEKQRLERENFALRQSVSFYELSEALSSEMPLDEKLDMIADSVRSNLRADGVEIIVEDPKNPGTYVHKARSGEVQLQAKMPPIIERFLQGEQLIAHGEEVQQWLGDPATAERRVEGFMAAPLKVRGAPLGVINAVTLRPGRRFTEGDRKGLSVFGGRAATAIQTARLHNNLKQTFTQTIEGFARALEAKDSYTAGHSDRVAMYARVIAQAMGLPQVEVDRIQHGGLMHDIGKIGIRSADLNKPQKLTPQEYLMFKSHPVKGRKIIEPIAFLVYLVPCVYYHHESYDGRGYPEGLGGDDIPFEARILAVADSYDAMTSDRPYRKALPHEIAVAELERCVNKQFDPRVVEAFLSVIDDFRAERRAQGLEVPD